MQDINGAVINALKTLPQIANSQYSCAFKQILAQINWNYSQESLQEVDALLLQIRQRAQLNYGVFVNSPEGQGFYSIVAFYCMATIAKLGNFMVKWFNYEEIKQITNNPNLPFVFESAASCVANNRVINPFSVISERLFAANMGEGFNVLAHAMLRESSEFFYLYDNLAKLAITDSMLQQHASLSQLSQTVGTLVSFNLATDTPATNFGATTLSPTADGKVTITRLMDSHNPTADIATELHQNPKNYAWLAGAYDVYSYPYSGRQDTLIVEAKSFTNQKPNELKIFFPYQPKTETSEFFLYKPMIMGTSWSMLELKIISYCVLTQIKNMPMAQEAWSKFYRPI